MNIDATFGGWDIKAKIKENPSKYGPRADLIIESVAFCDRCEEEADGGETNIIIELPLSRYVIKDLIDQLTKLL